MRRRSTYPFRLRAAALAVAIACVVCSSTAHVAVASVQESEITSLGKLALNGDTAPAEHPESVQPPPTPAPSPSSSSLSSSYSSSRDADAAVVIRVPIDLEDLVDDGSASSSGFSSSLSPFSSQDAEADAVARVPIDLQDVMDDESASSGGFLSSSSSSQDASENDVGGSSWSSSSEQDMTYDRSASLGSVASVTISFSSSSSSSSDSAGSTSANDVVLSDKESLSNNGTESGYEDMSASGSRKDKNDTIVFLLLSSASASGSESSSSVQIDDMEIVTNSSNATLSSSSDGSDSSSARLTNFTILTTELDSKKHNSSTIHANQHLASPDAVTKSDDPVTLQVLALSTNSADSDSDNTSDDVSAEASSPATTAVLVMHGVPSNPTMVNAVAYDGRAEVSWKAPEDDGSDPVTEYEVGWFDEEENVLVGSQFVTQVTATFNAAANGSSTVPSDAGTVPTSSVVTHLLNGRSYTFKVRAKNVNGYSVWSAKSLAVSPLHPPDLCGRISCSGRGTCFPNYHSERAGQYKHKKRSLKRTDTVKADETSSLDAQCICRPGFHPPDCSVKDEATQYVWKVSEWSECNSGCGGGKRTRAATCFDITTEKQAPSEELCSVPKKPSLTEICNGMECGSKLVSVKYEVEMSYDEVLFSPESVAAFELAFTTEVSAALQIPSTRIEVTALKRGSIAVFFQILPASRVGEKSLNDIVEKLQDELNNATSTLRSKGTFARRVEPNGVKLSFSIADQTVAGGAEDISILGLIGTVLVLCFFVFMFGWFLRKRHHRILKHEQDRNRPERVLDATQSEMKRMGIRTMA
uniref:Fibronectin type-III domain-containing protein n=1 Tax=Globisporangium ultimum (strain ATCC 200006 / CBS 805.95 / DAOM BR144) TaxID=431595 RepID=K3WYP8_GLOUD